MEAAYRWETPSGVSAGELGVWVRMERAARGVHWEMGKGLDGLAMIVCMAPFAGVLGTVFMILFDTFKGMGTDRATGLAMIAEGFSYAMAPTAIGLAMGVMALWGFRYFRGRMAWMDREMEGEALWLLNEMSRKADWEMGESSLPWLEEYESEARAKRRAGVRRAIGVGVVAGAAWVVWRLAPLIWPASLR